MPIAIRLDAAGSLVNAAQGAGGFATGQALQEMGLRQDQFNLQAQGQAQNYGLAQQRLAFDQQHQQDTTDLGYANLAANNQYRYDALGANNQAKYDLQGMRDQSQQELEHLRQQGREGLLNEQGQAKLQQMEQQNQYTTQRDAANNQFKAGEGQANRDAARSNLEYTWGERRAGQEDEQTFRAAQGDLKRQIDVMRINADSMRGGSSDPSVRQRFEAAMAHARDVSNFARKTFTSLDADKRDLDYQLTRISGQGARPDADRAAVRARLAVVMPRWQEAANDLQNAMVLAQQIREAAIYGQGQPQQPMGGAPGGYAPPTGPSYAPPPSNLGGQVGGDPAAQPFAAPAPSPQPAAPAAPQQITLPDGRPGMAYTAPDGTTRGRPLDQPAAQAPAPAPQQMVPPDAIPYATFSDGTGTFVTPDGRVFSVRQDGTVTDMGLDPATGRYTYQAALRRAGLPSGN